MERKSFTFKREYYEALMLLSKAKRLEVYEAICKYSLYGEMIPLKGHSFTAFTLIKPAIDKEIRQSQEGRRCEEYKEWRKNVFERDDYTCRHCGEKGCRLNAHHILSYANFPELRYELENGITLCEDCHKKCHRKKSEVDLGA